MKKILFSVFTIIIILSVFIISNFESATTTVFKPNYIEEAKAGLVDNNITGLVKGGTIENFNVNMPKGTIFLDKDKVDTALVGKDGYTLETYGNTNIVKKDIPIQENMVSIVSYLGPGGNGIPMNTEGYMTNTGINANAPENERSKFTMKFSDAVTMQDSSKKDVAITISNIYFVNQKSIAIPIWAGWRGVRIGTNAYDNEFNKLPLEAGKGMAIHCDISVSIINKDGTALKNQKLLLEVRDLDIFDKSRPEDNQSAYPKANDTRYNQGLTEEQKVLLYNSDYRESIQILNGAVSDAYMPETNRLEVKRLVEGTNANGLRFSAYEPEEDEDTLNTGFHVLVDSEESNYRWYGSCTKDAISTVLFTNTENHKITATSSTGGSISNFITSGETIENSDNYANRSYQNYFADGLNITYQMDAKESAYLEKITIDGVEFLQNDFSSVVSGEREKSVTITKNEKNYNFTVTKDLNGKITNAVYIFSNNDANHEISVEWKGIADYVTEYYYDNTIDNTKTETQSAPYGTVINQYTDKIIDGYTLQKVEGTPLTINEDSTHNVIKVYYVKRTDLSYTVNYLKKGTGEVIHTPKIVENKTYGEVINSSNEVIDIDTYNYDSADRDTLTISTNDNTINLYYVKNSNFIGKIKYYEKGTTNEIKPETTINNLNVGDVIESGNYNVEIDGYTYDSAEPTRITVTNNEAQNVMILYYTKKNNNLNYTVNYIDKSSNKVIHEQKIVTDVKLNDVIKAKDEVIEISNYKYDSSNKDQITISEDNSNNVINLYYTKKNGRVIVKYIDKDTNKEIVESETITGNVDDTYVAKIKEIDGYEYVSKKGNTTGKITDEDTNVIYYYKAKTEKKQAKDELQSLPKTGGINYLFIISAVTIMGILFGYGYIKLKDIK